MRIGGYRATTEIHLTDNELSLLGNPKKVDVLVDKSGTKNWVTIFNNISGTYSVSAIAQAIQNGRPHAHRVTIGMSRMHFGQFGMTTVEAYSPGSGTLIGGRPNMETPIVHRHRESIVRGKKGPMADVKRAVEVVNVFIRETKGVEVAIEEGQIKIRLLLEF